MPKANLICARYKFHEKAQGEHETFEHFVTELKLLVKDCGYTNSDEMVWDRIVFATNSPKVREKLLNQSADLTLEKAIDMAQSCARPAQDDKLACNGSTELCSTSSDKQKVTEQPRRKRIVTDKNRPCGRCALQHSQRDACPAKGHLCKICNKLNHFAKVCKSKQPVTRAILQAMAESHWM